MSQWCMSSQIITETQTQRKQLPRSSRRYKLGRFYSEVGVGMTITNHPLHRSGRALLTHPALALGDDAKSPERIRVMQRGWWQPTVSQMDHLLPSQSTRLAATPQRPVPVTNYLKAKRRQRVLVRRHPEVPVMTFNHRPKPLTNFGHSMMHSFAQFLSDFLQLGSFPFAHRAPQHRK